MSNSAKKSQQDEFSVSPMLQAFKIRQDRLPLRPGEASIEINGNRYTVEDISSFGLSIKAPCEMNFSDEASALIFSGDFLILSINLSKVREEMHDTFKKVAFETKTDFIPLNTVLGARDLRQILVSHEQFFKLDHIDPMFRATTFELSYWLKSLETKVNSLEVTSFEKSRAELDEYENIITLAVAQYINESVTPIYKKLEEICRNQDKYTQKEHFEFFRSVMGQYLFQSYYANRAFLKPLGYAGDFEMMKTVYQKELRGSSLFGRCVERYFTEVPEAQAVRNRGRYLQNKILEVLKKKPGAKILSVASGPAQEIQYLVSENHNLLKGSQIDLMDQDQEALKLSQRSILSLLRSMKVEANIQFHNYAVKNIIENGTPESGYDLIYTAGLFDYLTSGVAKAAARQLFNSLGPDGILVIGNFDTSAPNRFGMGLVTDWYLIYRTEDELINLFSFLGQVKIEKEPLGINLFAVICK